MNCAECGKALTDAQVKTHEYTKKRAYPGSVRNAYCSGACLRKNLSTRLPKIGTFRWFAGSTKRLTNHTRG